MPLSWHPGVYVPRLFYPAACLCLCEVNPSLLFLFPRLCCERVLIATSALSTISCCALFLCLASRVCRTRAASLRLDPSWGLISSFWGLPCGGYCCCRTGPRKSQIPSYNTTQAKCCAVCSAKRVGKSLEHTLRAWYYIEYRVFAAFCYRARFPVHSLPAGQTYTYFVQLE